MSTSYHIYGNDFESKMITTFIYGLKDPRTGKVRYVGKSNNPNKRFSRHMKMSEKADWHCYAWIRSLTNVGIEPELVILGEVSIESWQESEKAWIRLLNSLGNELTNINPGGESGPVSPETRAKMSAAKKGKPQPWLRTPEAIKAGALARTGKKRAPCSEARRAKLIGRYVGRSLTEEWKQKISEANKGKKRSPESRAKMSVSQKGRKASPETRKKLSEAQKRRKLNTTDEERSALARKAWKTRRRNAAIKKNDGIPCLFE